MKPLCEISDVYLWREKQFHPALDLDDLNACIARSLVLIAGAQQTDREDEEQRSRPLGGRIGHGRKS